MKDDIRDILIEFDRNIRKFHTIGDRTFNSTSEIYKIAKTKIQALISQNHIAKERVLTREEIKKVEKRQDFK